MDYTPGGEVSALTFTVSIGGKKHVVRLDPKTERVLATFWRHYEQTTDRSYRRKSRSDFADQAKRTAWKLLQDWLEVELSRVALDQGEFEEIFLAHIWDGEQTSYQYLKSGGFRALLPEKTETPI